MVSLCSCHCLLTPPVRTNQGKWQEPGHEAGAERRESTSSSEEEAENRDCRGVSCRGCPWTAIFPELIMEWMKHTPPLPPLDLSTHQLNTLHTFRWLPSPVISLRPIFLLFRGKDSACCCFSSLKNFPTIFSAQWLSGCLSCVFLYCHGFQINWDTWQLEDVSLSIWWICKRAF